MITAAPFAAFLFIELSCFPLFALQPLLMGCRAFFISKISEGRGNA
jgi:hypothetical protein